MRKWATALCIAASLSLLPGCATLGGVGGALTNGTPVATGNAGVIAAKSWYDAEAAYSAIAGAYRTANEHGYLSPSLKAQIRPKLLILRKARKAVEDAHTGANAGALADKLTAFNQIANDVKALIPTG